MSLKLCLLIKHMKFTSKMLFNKAKKGASGKPAENIVMNPYCITNSKYSSNKANWSHAYEHGENA